MKEVVIEYCSRSEWDRLAKTLESLGAMWVTGDKPTKYMSTSPVPHCIRLEDGKTIVHGDRQYYESNYRHLQILSVEEFLKQNGAETMELKVYDKVYLKKDAGSYKKGDCLTYWGGTNFSQSGKSNLSVGKWERSEFFTKEKPAVEPTSKFKVGDRVRAIGKVDGYDMTGKLGTVVHVDNAARNSVAVEFDESLDWRGHNCDGRAKDGHGRYASPNELEIVNVGLPTHPRTFRLVKETPEAKVGAVFQLVHNIRGEAMYKLLPESKDLNKSNIDIFYSANVVEEQPEWFEEVFRLKVEKWVTKTEYVKAA